MRKYVLMSCLVVASLLLPGCSTPSSEPLIVQSDSSDGSAVDSVDFGQPAVRDTDESRVARPPSISSDDPSRVPDQGSVKGLAGKWLLTLVFEAETSQPWMIEVTGNEQSYDAKVVGSIPPVKPEIRGFRQVADQVHFELAQGKESWLFDGAIVAGRVRGCIEVRAHLTLAWLERTRLTSMRGIQTATAVADWSSFEAAQQGDDPNKLVAQMQDFVEHHADSPLIFDALRTVLQLSRRAELSEEQLRRVTERCQELSKVWGKRWSEHSVEAIASDLATADGPPNAAADAMALEFAENARAALPEAATASRKQAVQLAHAVALVRNDRAEEGKKLLDELLARATDEADPRRFYAAQAAEKLSDLDGAIEFLIPLWPHPLATREIERIWQQKNGNLAGLDERLDEIYLKRSAPLPVEAYPGREFADNNTIALAELFTGTSCFPCVPHDAAFEALRRTFKPSELVLLQYHLHVPGADPLANADAIKRAEYYEVQGTPWFLLNGREVAQARPKQKSPMVYAQYRGEIENELERTSEAKLKISATRDQDEITIDVSLRNVPDPGERMRLRLALVEETVRFHGRNGVRLHHAVVRAMPGGAAGIEVTQSDLTHHTAINVTKLRESLNNELAEFEKNISAENNGAFEFPSKPLELKHLGIVAFLQDDSTRTVLQAAFVEPVEASEL